MNPKKTPRTRLLAITSATLALVVAGGAVASAHPGSHDGRGLGRDRGDQQFRGGSPFGGGQPSRGGAWRMAQRMPGLRGALIDGGNPVVRRETTFETTDGIVTQRVDHGTTTNATDSSIEYTLATGESVSVAVDAETQVISFSEATLTRGPRSRTRLIPSEVAITDVTAGSDIGVWAESQDDGTFMAQRIVIRPDLAKAVADDAATDTGADAATDTDADAAATTDASSPTVSDA